jgi:hypothetical protein
MNKLFTGLDGYRIGEMLQFEEYRNDEKFGKKYHLKKFPNSIASKYLKLSNDNNNYKLIKEIIKNTNLKNYHKVLPKNYCIVQLRVGDVIDLDKWSVEQFLNEERLYKNGINYVKDKNFFINKINKLKSYNMNNVLISAGSHFLLESFEKSYEYINKIKYLFEDENYNVKLLLGIHPDDNMIISLNADYFIGSGGSYSNLLSNITNGIII